jgi:hypothetical protein
MVERADVMGLWFLPTHPSSLIGLLSTAPGPVDPHAPFLQGAGFFGDVSAKQETMVRNSTCVRFNFLAARERKMVNLTPKSGQASTTSWTRLAPRGDKRGHPAPSPTAHCHP